MITSAISNILVGFSHDFIMDLIIRFVFYVTEAVNIVLDFFNNGSIVKKRPTLEVDFCALSKRMNGQVVIEICRKG